ncbi:MAG: hypothetical protein ACFFCQ_08225 [Promethearchaeota archaeon]
MIDSLEFEEIEPTIEKIKNTIIMMKEKIEEELKRAQELENQLNEREKRTQQLEKEISQREKKLGELEREISERERKLKEEIQRGKQLESEKMDIQEELERISTLYGELTGKQQDVSSIKNLLDVYVTLLETIYKDRPHVKILLMLMEIEGNKMTREALTKSTGFQPAAMRYAIKELANAELVAFDEEKDIVTLNEARF